MSFTLPLVPSDPRYRFTADLDGVSYRFDVDWNDREAAWYLTLATGAGDIILDSCKLMVSTLVGARCVDPRMPAGSLMVFDTSGTGIEAALADLGARVQVIYTTYAEMLASGLITLATS